MNRCVEGWTGRGRREEEKRRGKRGRGEEGKRGRGKEGKRR